MRIEPPPSLPVASGHRYAASAAAAPPLDPPGVWSGFQGLPPSGPSRFWQVPTMPSSEALVLPRMTAPPRTHALHHRGIPFGNAVLEPDRAHGRADARGHLRVLDRDRQPVQGAQLIATQHGRLRGPGLRHRRVAREQQERVQPRVEPLDTVEEELGKLHRRCVLAGDEPQQLGGGRVRQFVMPDHSTYPLDEYRTSQPDIARLRPCTGFRAHRPSP